jgi:ATP-dependent DNA helicase RecG
MALKFPQPTYSIARLEEFKKIFKDYPSENVGNRRIIFNRGVKLLNEAKTFAFLDRDIQYVKGVGPKRASNLHKLGIYKIRDLLMHFPRRHEDRSQFIKIAETKLGDYVTLKGEIRARDDRTLYGRTKITKAIIDDGSGRITGVWFKQPYMKNLLPIGKEIILSGTVTEFSGKQIAHPVFELSEKNDPVHTGRIVPLYPLTKGIGMRYLRALVDRVLKEPTFSLAEYLPENLINTRELMNFGTAISKIHFPKNIEEKEKARKRFIYEEFLFLQIGLLLMRNMKKKGRGLQFKSGDNLAEKLEEVLPFSLTDSQKKVLNRIKKDMASSQRMMRLLHGEVGSGKTVVALGAILLAQENGYQSAIMAPTAILAEQHYLTLQKFALPLGMEIELLISGQKENERRDILKRLKEGSIDVLIGTHALLQENVEFKKLGLAVIDEEHKFGVLQRAHFSKIFDKKVEILVMSATPIPRSLALALYGDMDISTIDELPPERAQTSTFWINEKDKDKVYDFIKEELDKGMQAFIVTPLIEESEKLKVNSALEVFEFLKDEIFFSYKLDLLHGRMKKKEQKSIMENFRNKKIDVLVATSLVEVGIDIPSATVMLVLNAERFGLAQLHQLRGRIGRGEYNSYCILVSTPKTEEGKRRLKAMVSTSDGFEIAEEDLEIRGPGEFLGTKQHGFPEMKLGNILKDLRLLEQAREDAELFLKEDLNLENYGMMKDILLERFPYIKKMLGKQNTFLIP